MNIKENFLNTTKLEWALHGMPTMGASICTSFPVETMRLFTMVPVMST